MCTYPNPQHREILARAGARPLSHPNAGWSGWRLPFAGRSCWSKSRASLSPRKQIMDTSPLPPHPKLGQYYCQRWRPFILRRQLVRRGGAVLRMGMPRHVVRDRREVSEARAHHGRAGKGDADTGYRDWHWPRASLRQHAHWNRGPFRRPRSQSRHVGGVPQALRRTAHSGSWGALAVRQRAFRHGEHGVRAAPRRRFDHAVQ